jgi:hypothetical protein
MVRVWPSNHFQFLKGAVMSNFSTVKRIVVTAALVGAVSGLAQAADTTRAQNFATQNEALQDESTAMPYYSEPVNRNAAPADPIPKVSGLQGEEARFRGMDQQLQDEATSMPVGSPPVNKNSVNADPRPGPLAEERFLEQNSTK